MGPGVKKRRKKKYKTSTTVTNESADGSRSSSPKPDVAIAQQVPDGVLRIKQERKISQSNSPPDMQQTTPMNLKTNELSKIKSEFHGNESVYSPANSETSNVDSGSGYSAVCKIGKLIYENNKKNFHIICNNFFSMVYIEIDDVDQTFHCKKVKRAHESKGLVAAASPKVAQSVSPQPAKAQLSPSSALMRPPNYIDTQFQSQATDLSLNTGESVDLPASPQQSDNKRTINTASNRPKRLRFRKQVSIAGMNETKVDDITTDIIIPRERVISICNLDKDALDDYLNEGDNSQEQEAELLQYFQPTSSTTTTAVPSNEGTGSMTVAVTMPVNNVVSSATMPMISTTAAQSGQYPVLDNYPLYQQTGTSIENTNNNRSGNIQEMSMPSRNQDQINELRQYLQQNFRGTSSGSIVPPPPPPPHPISTGIGFNEDSTNIPSNVAIQNQYPSTVQQMNLNQMDKHDFAKQKLNINTHQMPHLMRSISASATVGTNLQSPNSRRKNFSFVPISPGPQSPRVFANNIPNNNNNQMNANNINACGHIGMQSSPFVSPRATPALRKPINKDLATSLASLSNDPMIGTCKTAFSKPYLVKDDISASAPVSPSMIPHQFHFNHSMIAPYSNPSVTTNSTSMPVGGQPPHQHQSTCSISGMCPILESRSQSVPLHCQSPGYNTPGPNTAYNSTCNSIAQTPVPSEFADFTDDNILNIFADTSSDQNIKLEDNDIPNLMDTNHLDAMLPDDGNNMASMSRSVPSTPLPIRGYGSHNLPLVNTSMSHSMIGSKTVPSTPIGLNSGSGGTPFRYSPEHHRDFLINGNTIDTAKQNNQFFSSTPVSRAAIIRQQSLPASTTNLHSIPSDQIDELSNYSDVNDPIIAGSDLLHNL